MSNSRQSSLVNFMDNLKPDPQKTYQIIEKLGEGTYATVYKALNKITDKLVAIKMFPAHNDQYAYLNEIEFLRKIDHPYMVKLQDVYTTGDEIWMILDYCQLGSIHDIIQTTDQTLSEPEIACVCFSVLQALDYIHTLNKIHRDVKSANILINSFGQVKLTDFGICSQGANSDSFIGSLLWMAPEMVSCGSYTSSVDIWALGICVIEMAEGSAPYSHLHMVRAKFAIQKKPQTQFTEPYHYSEEIKDFLSQCLQMKPEDRPTASELLKHPFIEKYKWDFSSIRKKLYQERIEKVTAYKKSMIINKNQGNPILKEVDQSQEQAHCNRIEQQEESPYEDNTRHLNISHIDVDDMENNQSVIEKPCIDTTNEHPDSIIEHSVDIHTSVIEDHHHHTGSQLQYAIKHIKLEQMAEDIRIDDADKETLQEEQRIVDSRLSNSPPKYCLSKTSSKDMSQERSYRDREVPKLDLKSPVMPFRSQMPATSNMYSQTKELANSPGLKSSIASSIGEIFEAPSTTSLQNKLTKATKNKMYKITNESNFVVKHQGATRTNINTYLNQSIESESSLNPISLDRRKDIDDLQEGCNFGLVEQIMKVEGHKASSHTISTATQSKVGSKGGSSFFKTPGHTPNPSGKHKTTIYNIVKENLMVYEGSKSDKNGVEDEKVRLEEQMKREMEEIQRKYKMMLQNLEKET